MIKKIRVVLALAFVSTVFFGIGCENTPPAELTASPVTSEGEEMTGKIIKVVDNKTVIEFEQVNADEIYLWR